MSRNFPFFPNVISYFFPRCLILMMGKFWGNTACLGFASNMNMWSGRIRLAA